LGHEHEHAEDRDEPRQREEGDAEQRLEQEGPSQPQGDGGLPAQQLWWRVRARNAAGVFGPFSSTGRFTPVPPTTGPSLSAVAISPTSVVGGASSTGTVTLTAAAPTGGLAVALSSSSAAATVPGSVTVPAGATTATFTVTTTAVTAQASSVITASAAGVSRTATLTVDPASTGALPAPSLLAPAADARFNAGQTIVFDWSDVSGAASYTIQVDDQIESQVRTIAASSFSPRGSRSAPRTSGHRGQRDAGRLPRRCSPGSKWRDSRGWNTN
jgi:hypothetical protein